MAELLIRPRIIDTVDWSNGQTNVRIKRPEATRCSCEAATCRAQVVEGGRTLDLHRAVCG
jgi:hypothetical protein